MTGELSTESKIKTVAEWSVTILCLAIILAAMGLGAKYFAWMMLADQFIIPSQSMRPTLLPGDRDYF